MFCIYQLTITKSIWKGFQCNFSPSSSNSYLKNILLDDGMQRQWRHSPLRPGGARSLRQEGRSHKAECDKCYSEAQDVHPASNALPRSHPGELPALLKPRAAYSKMPTRNPPLPLSLLLLLHLTQSPHPTINSMHHMSVFPTRLWFVLRNKGYLAITSLSFLETRVSQLIWITWSYPNIRFIEKRYSSHSKKEGS